jgi:tagatose 1,6-diphosphate aldolase
MQQFGGFMKFTKKKFDRMQNVSHKKGYIAAAAMDQRGSLKKSIAKARGIEADAVTDEVMAEFKTAVTKVLTPHASAILLDPEYGLEAAKQRSADAGLLLAYEQTGYDNSQPGKIPQLLENWSVAQAVEAGADCTKLLIYYHPDEEASINEQKHLFVEKVGAECAQHEMPFFLEFVGYGLNGEDPKTDVAYAKAKPAIVRKSIEEFTKDRYQCSVLKVEIPVNVQCVEGSRAYAGQTAYSMQEALQQYRDMASVSSCPFIYLSAGVSDDEFREGLELAGEAGVKYHGVLCGRATWKEGIPIFGEKGGAALEDWLQEYGVRNIQALNTVLEQTAAPWNQIYGGLDKLEIGS